MNLLEGRRPLEIAAMGHHLVGGGNRARSSSEPRSERTGRDTQFLWSAMRIDVLCLSGTRCGAVADHHRSGDATAYDPVGSD